jgi:hypothetical protein
MKTKRISLIADHINLKRYSMNDFWAVCPFDQDEFRPDERTASIRSWKQLGMVWARLSGFTSTESGRMFYRDHSTCLHAEKIVLDTLIDFKIGCKHVWLAMNEIKDHCNRYTERYQDMCVNEAVSIVLLENLNV